MLKKKSKIFIKKYFPNGLLSLLRKLEKFSKRNFTLLLYRLGIKNFKSNEFWINRYKKGGDSGRGSYNQMAYFKADVLNNFVKENKISSVIEFGSGDGNQLKYFIFSEYLGFDISPEMISLCKNKFEGDASKGFMLMNEYKDQKADLVLSLDVIYHLIEDDVFNNYMERLFDSSERFVVIYSSNKDEKGKVPHIKHRKFSGWVDKNRPDWVLFNHISNKYPEKISSVRSFANFYFYKKSRNVFNRLIINMEKEKLLKKFNEAEEIAVAYKKLEGPGLFKKIKRLTLLRSKYFKQVLLRLDFSSREIKTKLFFGKKVKMPLSDSVPRKIYLFKILDISESSLTRFFIKNLNSKDIFYDIGASYGFYTFLAQEIINKGEIHSFEPIKNIFKYLKLNSDSKNTYLNKKALSDTNGEAILFDLFDEGTSGASSLIEAASVNHSKKIKVETVTLDEYIKNNKVPTVIKIDVEGAEYMVLEGGKKFFSEHSLIVVMEVWSGEKGKKFSKKSVDKIKELGFNKIYKIKSDGELESISEIDFDQIEGENDNFVFKKE